jgi:hypothetical protein
MSATCPWCDGALAVVNPGVATTWEARTVVRCHACRADLVIEARMHVVTAPHPMKTADRCRQAAELHAGGLTAKAAARAARVSVSTFQNYRRTGAQ